LLAALLRTADVELRIEITVFCAAGLTSGTTALEGTSLGSSKISCLRVSVSTRASSSGGGGIVTYQVGKSLGSFFVCAWSTFTISSRWMYFSQAHRSSPRPNSHSQPQTSAPPTTAPQASRTTSQSTQSFPAPAGHAYQKPT
jgi:hypothetical protein